MMYLSMTLQVLHQQSQGLAQPQETTTQFLDLLICIQNQDLLYLHRDWLEKFVEGHLKASHEHKDVIPTGPRVIFFIHLRMEELLESYLG